MPVSIVRRSTVSTPSNAGGCAALVVSDPLNAVVFASKLPPIVIGHLMRTSACPARHVLAAEATAPARSTTSEIPIPNFQLPRRMLRDDFPWELGVGGWRFRLIKRWS